MEQLRNMMNTPKCHLMMYMALVFALLLTAPAAVCGGAPNDAYSYTDDFDNSLGLDMTASHGVAIIDGKLVSYAADALAVSKCISLLQPEGSEFEEWSCLKMNLVDTLNPGSLAIKRCDDGTVLKPVINLSTADQPIDLSDIPSDATAIRLEWSPAQIDAKADSWEVYGKAYGATAINIVADTNTSNAGDTVTFTIQISSSGVETQKPVLRFSLDDINGLHTADIDDGLAEDAEVDYGSGVNPYRPLEFVFPPSAGPNGESADVSAVHDVGDFKNVSGEVVWKLDKLTDGSSDNVTVTLKIPQGYINDKTLAARATLEHGMACNQMTLEAISGLVTVTSERGQYQSPIAPHDNVGSGAENIRDLYIIYNKLPSDTNKSDLEDVTFTITGIGDCTPLYSDIDVWDPYSSHKISTPDKGDPITDSNPVIVEFDRIDFYSASARVYISYDVPEGCGEENEIGTQSQVVDGKPEWNDLDSISHPVLSKVCREGNNHVHRLMSGNDPMNYFRWPGVGEFYINKKGSLRAGEYFSTWAPYGNEHYRTQTICLDHSYDLIEIPAGITFHGIRETNRYTRFYKDCTGTAPVPTDPEFDHNADPNVDPPHPAWKKVETDWKGIPFSNPPDDNDSEAIVQPGCRLLSVKDNDNPKWEPGFGHWCPRFLWRVCDGDYGCTELPEGTAMSLGGGDIYTYETSTDTAGAVHECFSHDGWIVYKEAKSWPKVYAWPAKDQAPAGDYAHIIVTPENSNYASQYVDGRWAVNLYDVKDYIDFKYITGEVLTDGFNIPKPDQNVTGEKCNVADDIIFHAPEGECNDPNDSGCMAWWEVPPACQPPNGWGYRDGNNNPEDDYLQMYRFRLNALIKKTTPANTELCFVAEVRTNDLGARGADNAVATDRWSVSNYVSTACVTVLETPGLDIEKTGPVNRKAGDLFSYNLELKNTGNAPSNGWYWIDGLPKEGVNESDFTPEYRKIYIDRPAGDVIAEYSTDDQCFAAPLGVAWTGMAEGITSSDRTGFQAETVYNINAEARCIRLRKNPDAQWNFNPGDKILSAIDFKIPDDRPEGLRICNRALAGASVDFGGSSDLYPVETVNVCTEVNDAVYIEVKKRGNKEPEGIKWTITVENRSGTEAKNITVTDDLPDRPDVGYGGVVEDTLPDGWTVVEEPAIGASGGQLVINIPLLTPDDGNPGSGFDEGSFSLVSSLDKREKITNCVTVETIDDWGGEWGGQSKDCVTIEKGNLIPDKIQIAVDRASGTDETELFPGDAFSYVIIATNDSEASQGVFLKIRDKLDDYLDYVGNTFTVNGAAASDSFFSGGVLDYSHPVAVNPGETLTLKFNVRVKPDAPHGYLIENRALIISCTDPDDPDTYYFPQETPVVYAWVVNTQCNFNLRVRANRVQVQPTWTHTGAAPYDLYRRVGADTDFRRIATIEEKDIQWIMATYLDREVQTGLTYYYYVANRNGCRSDIASVTPESLIPDDEIVDPDDDFENPTPPGDPEKPGDGDDDPVLPDDSDNENPVNGTFRSFLHTTVCGGLGTGVGLYGKDGNIQAYILNESGKLAVDITPYLDDEKYYAVSGYFYESAGQCGQGSHEYFHVEYVEALPATNPSYIPLPLKPDSSPVPVPIYRLYSPTFNRHHYCDEYEANYLLANYPEEIWTLETGAFYAYRNAENGTMPVYRLYNEYLREHLFTMDANEKDTLVNADEDSWKYEGVAFYVDPEPVDGTVPVWRLYSDDLQTHLLTTDVNEKERLLASPGWHDEGVAYYVYAAE